EGEQVDELAPLAVLVVGGRPESDQLGSMLLEEAAGMVAEAPIQVVELAFIRVVGPQLVDPAGRGGPVFVVRAQRGQSGRDHQPREEGSFHRVRSSLCVTKVGSSRLDTRL